jgi:hypothetical protein
LIFGYRKEKVFLARFFGARIIHRRDAEAAEGEELQKEVELQMNADERRSIQM